MPIAEISQINGLFGVNEHPKYMTCRLTREWREVYINQQEQFSRGGQESIVLRK
jgi:hypothetical protein